MAPLLKVLVLLNFSLYAAAQGTQFITGNCTSDADCASVCCGFNSGKCAAPIPAQERDGGCGFGDATPNAGPNANTGAAAGGNGNTAASSSAATSPAASSAAGAGSGKALGTQFITGACASDAECQSACCGFKSGKCAGPAVAQERDGGCGFGDAQPNYNAAKTLQARSLGKFGPSFM
ncbi:hypothetical protein BU23DRAFT_510077 [Bimuria novae-zelandiae CBS 107.79]|uniref:Biotrophy-associated secreted protein 2 n=1 Tax=Bimuria novae-zelandiae CBS 107.79 TaxID=1447943 RepID=A0A6A5V482_9PLEO|nr:hypothetical protein BU23DRAFT_510077 [Bimuria novae-zelandiae CBS 107.79]